MERIGRYDIVEEVGRGGMGIVYRCVDTALGRTVAVKTVRLSEYTTPHEALQLRERLLREARAAGLLAHPNIVAVHDLGQEGDTTYIVMEFVQGRTLDQVLAESTPPPQEWCLKVLEGAARGLDHAHAQGVYHRDVKPGNIMVQDNGEVKIADFGIAKLTWQKTITETGMVVGSPHYMAPEQLKGEPLSGRSDQFALAAVAYTMLTGHKPFEADTLASLVSKILHDEPPPAQTLNPALGPEVERVLRKAMSKDPAGRYATCADFVDALKAARKPAVKPPAPSHGVRLRWGAISAVAACLLIVTAAAYLLLDRHQAAQAEIAYWDSIKGRKDPASFEAYLKRYAAGRFRELARAEIEALRRQPPAVPPPKPPPPARVKEVQPTPEREPVERPASAGAKVKPAPPPESARVPKPGMTVTTNPADGQRYAWIPAGTFQMGCSPGDGQCVNDEKPARTVVIPGGLWMGQTEVTLGAYRRFSGAAGRSAPAPPASPQDENHPVVSVTWHDAAAYCQWAGGRLPTEAEWEYAARAGTAGPYYGELSAIAWYTANSGGRTQPVGQKQPNAWRLYDMLGNVWEWVADWYGENYYAASETRNPQGPPGGGSRVLRGGSWNYLPWNLRASSRHRNVPGNWLNDVGFRCMRELIP
ncbi:MAG: bifunctional serine/threonine-protein kinase/formylglycine-generating enzyme family protein [Acidobacteriota bacterium]